MLYLPQITARPASWLVVIGLLACMSLASGCGNRQEPPTKAAEFTADNSKPAVPTWVTTAPESDLENERFVVHGELYATKQEARSKHERMYEKQLRERLDIELAEIAGTTDAVEQLGYQIDQLDSHVERTSVYLESKVTSVGMMYQFHSLVEMSNGIKDKLRQMWNSFQGVNRALQIALYWLAILGSIGIVTIYLESGWKHRAALSAGLAIGQTVLLSIASQWIHWI